MLLLKVAILSLLHPQQVTVNNVSITRQGTQLAVAGKLQSNYATEGKFQIRVAPDFQRTYTGRLEITAKKNELQLILTATEEALIAAIVGAESPPSAPAAALEAQAIVTRSWLRASRNRHGRYDLCDTTHCQHFKEPTPHGFRAAAKTKNLILVWQGQPFAPAYSASCGGRTKTAAAIGWRDEETMDSPFRWLRRRHAPRTSPRRSDSFGPRPPPRLGRASE
jgi:peptidoglycan hydrolase-like amidase